MKEWIAKYQKAIVGTGAISVLLICYAQQKELTKLRSENKIEFIEGGDIRRAEYIDSIKHVNDSLQSELFVNSIELGRYKVAYEIFTERNPKAASQYGDIISNETE
jgi:hypothetical protein